jgi:hypothetical protein
MMKHKKRYVPSVSIRWSKPTTEENEYLMFLLRKKIFYTIIGQDTIESETSLVINTWNYMPKLIGTMIFEEEFNGDLDSIVYTMIRARIRMTGEFLDFVLHNSFYKPDAMKLLIMAGLVDASCFTIMLNRSVAFDNTFEYSMHYDKKSLEYMDEMYVEPLIYMLPRRLSDRLIYDLLRTCNARVVRVLIDKYKLLKRILSLKDPYYDRHRSILDVLRTNHKETFGQIMKEKLRKIVILTMFFKHASRVFKENYYAFGNKGYKKCKSNFENQFISMDYNTVVEKCQDLCLRSSKK